MVWRGENEENRTLDAAFKKLAEAVKLLDSAREERPFAGGSATWSV